MRNSSGRTILVIDDNAVVLEVTRSTLEQAGFRVVTRDRASGAVSAVLHERPDLVLLDVNMPNMTGDSLADVLGRTRATRGTLVVLYSSLPANALRMKAMAAGAHGFIQKTSAQSELVRQVRAFLEQDSLGAQRVASILAGEEGTSSARIRVAAPVDEPLSAAPPSSRPFRSSSGSPAEGAPTILSASAPPPLHDSGTIRLIVPTALFLDDDLAVLTGYRRALSSDEVIGEYLTSADQAVRRLSAAEPPDVVVTDLVMPGMNGMELYRRALELDPTWRHRFVFITGAGTLSHIAEFLRRVGGRALEKPVDIRRLRDAIRYAATGARIFRKHSAGG
ncbi:MAG TPA: response regulator [Polyangiaceae bacterium]|jgi:DNA-binding NarL/FixJ family response regulator